MRESADNYLDLIRFFKPGGTLLIFLPHAWGLTMAAYAHGLEFKIYLQWLAKFLAWSFTARCLGCTINDICDYEYDRKVERTKTRPIASGKISLRSAGIFTAAQLLVYLALMWTNDSVQRAYRMICLPLIFLYPVMKRITYFPQAWLGIAMNWGSVIAWVTVCGRLNPEVIAPLMGGLWA
ncbi:hypothetical protein D9619_008305 [Psilocybe cf. subviscida]|uniref:4-hydroxybenzoate polyprenyl transferase n=1 Tax=Psilocybe cf. subviscida TaxID=2480587 RepID=A0A8H5B9Z2_9AGAR|nr:hypothetical protein D9619_008305 [Psilocybe cf. subviscida]